MKFSAPTFLLLSVCVSVAAITSNHDELNAFQCPAGSVSSNDGKVCCPASCGSCGGFGCHLRPGGDTKCCTKAATKSCNDSVPPCLASTQPQPEPTGVCPAGSIPDSKNKVCCPQKCGSCGGFGCHLRPGGDKKCCTSNVTESCATSAPPCVSGTTTPTKPPTTPPTCPLGSIASADGEACCPATCGMCGGYGCHLRPGGDTDCCTGKITRSCDVFPAPCAPVEVVPPPEPAPINPCPAGGIASKDSDACCPLLCGTCGGFGCHLRPGGASKCCTSTFTNPCSTSAPPCLVDETEPPTPAPTVAPV